MVFGWDISVRSAQWLSWLVLALFVYGCEGTSTVRRTQLVLVADTDIAELEQAVFEITSPDGKTQRASGAIAQGVPAYVVLAHESNAPLGPYLVQVQGLAAQVAVVSRSARVTFVADRTRVVPLNLLAACLEEICEGDLVCGAEGCRPETLSPGELLPWDGSPPTLASLDAGADDAGAVAVDAEAVDAEVVDGSALDGAGPCTPSCEGNAERLCQDGVLLPARSCESLDPCSSSVCEPGLGCVTSAKDGAACGSGGLTCQAGVCGSGQACTQDCSPQCNAGTSQCNLDCGATGGNCKPSCPANASCEVRCDGVSNCDVSCSGTCQVTCGGASNCVVTCRPGSRCDVDCTGSANCDKARCQAGVSCLLRCGSNGSCKPDAWCTGGTALDCGAGVWACRSECPAL